MPLLCVQWKTPDDGQRNCSKHVEFYSKNKLEKLMHLVGFITRIYQDAFSPERQINFIVMTKISDIFLPLQAKNDFGRWVCHHLRLKRRQRCKYCVKLVRKRSSFCKESSSFRMSTDNTGRFVLRMLSAGFWSWRDTQCPYFSRLKAMTANCSENSLNVK